MLSANGDFDKQWCLYEPMVPLLTNGALTNQWVLTSIQWGI